VLVAHLVAAAVGAVLLLAVAGARSAIRLWAARASARVSAVSRYRKEMLAFVGHSAVRATLKVLTRRFDSSCSGTSARRRRSGRTARPCGWPRSWRRSATRLTFAAFPQLARAWVEARDEFFRLVRLMATAWPSSRPPW
jgi:hypothetical protein